MEIPEGISQTGNISVFQSDNSLSEDRSHAGCYPLATLNTAIKVEIRDTADNWSIDIPLGNDPCILFKLSGRGLEYGRKVTRVSSGLYLAIAPQAWRRDEARAASMPTTAEPVFLDGYMAHFFNLHDEESRCIAFLDGHDRSITVGSPCPQFSLLGDEIQDASEQLGPLFGGSPPKITIENGQWSEIRTIVVGQEGSGRRRWRDSFEPKADQAQQELPNEILKRKAGWYFLRFYDSTGALLDSLDFRFVAGLKQIPIATADPVPPPGGHVAQTVEILHDAGYKVMPAAHESPDVTVEHSSEKTILTIPPTAGCDCTRWRIQPLNSGGNGVEFTLLIERFWWARSTDDKEPGRWGDRCVELTPEDFTAASGKAIWLRLPKPRWANNIFAGFTKERARKLPVKVTERDVCISLPDFSGAQELDGRAGKCSFWVWLETKHGDYEVPVAQVYQHVIRWGRYKTAIAKAGLQTGSGDIKVNGMLVDQYFRHAPRKAQLFLRKFCALPEVKRILSELDIDVTIWGSNPTTIRQTKAAVHAMARALWTYDHKLKRVLRQAGFGGTRVPRKPRR
ncbi:MAG: mitochondrial small ribosomal subunit protein uS9m [Acidobacteriia bacterium]|nr:30S ribosomal protein S9 [Methyloceanibacter sp.]MBX5494570.1 30S ribosomal protein S9 [Bryobacteraceae bacterium]MCL6491793.1 mitochondrial small ribosomal subunit protein uS9m [Terriglobia bacterium]